MLDIGRTAVANNLFGAFVNSNILGILVFSLWLGFVLMKQREHNEHIRYFVGIMEGLTESLMGMLQFVIDFTPIAVLSLLASHVSGASIFCNSIVLLAAQEHCYAWTGLFVK